MKFNSFLPFTDGQTILSNIIIFGILGIWIFSVCYLIWKNFKISSYFKKQTVDAILKDEDRLSLKGIKKHFIDLFKKKNLNVRFTSYSSQKIRNVEILSGFYIFSYDGMMNMVRRIPARYTFVTLQDKKGIKIINHHSSLNPKW